MYLSKHISLYIHCTPADGYAFASNPQNLSLWAAGLARRVVPNGEGSEFLFTLFQRPEMSKKQFEEDAQAVAQDLKTLKQLLEAGS